jgi:hypothetical protein
MYQEASPMKILILVCALNVAAPDCQKDTAIDVFYAPPAGEDMSGCARQGLMFAAESRLVRPGSYAKIVCQNGVRGKTVANAVGNDE